jgi:hypothetical protein
MRRLVGLLPVAILLLALAEPASSVPPDRFPLPPTEDFVDEVSCDFPIEVHFVTEKLTEKTFFDGAGNVTKVIVTGPLKIENTNLDTNTSLTLNLPGPGITLFEDGEPVVFKAVGPWVLFFLPGDLGPGHPGGLFLTHGRVVFDLVQGDVTVKGKIQSLCDLLS